MSESLHGVLNVVLLHKVHPGLLLDIKFQLGREIGVVFGRSGAGKSTLLRLIAGLITPQRARIQLDDAILCDSAGKRHQPLRRRRIGMIFQDDCLFPHLNVTANIRFGLKGWQDHLVRDRVALVAALCEVEHLLDRHPETLSGGERQRVGLARALAPRPRLLLCDEPVSALDLAGRHSLLERLRAVQQAEQIPMLYVTHSPAEAIAFGSRLFLLEEGRIIADGPPLDVLSSARGVSPESIGWEGIRNVFPARVLSHAPERGATYLVLENGPELTVPFLDRAPGTRAVIEIRADDILLARQPIEGLSARNQLPGTIERIVSHGTDAEVVVRTGSLTWIVSVVSPAVEQLGLEPGSPILLIVKARSCHVA